MYCTRSMLPFFMISGRAISNELPSPQLLLLLKPKAFVQVIRSFNLIYCCYAVTAGNEIHLNWGAVNSFDATEQEAPRCRIDARSAVQILPWTTVVPQCSRFTLTDRLGNKRLQVFTVHGIWGGKWFVSNGPCLLLIAPSYVMFSKMLHCWFPLDHLPFLGIHILNVK